MFKEPKKSQRKVVIDDFEMMRVLGKGCAGKVLLVRHKQTSDQGYHQMTCVGASGVATYAYGAGCIEEGLRSLGIRLLLNFGGVSMIKRICF